MAEASTLSSLRRTFLFSLQLNFEGKALAEASLPGEPRIYDARSKRSGVPLTTLYYRNYGRRSKEKKAQSQQYLTPLCLALS